MSKKRTTHFIDSLKRMALLSLLFSASSSCSRPSCCAWETDSAIGTARSLNSARLYLCPGNEHSGLALEFVLMRDSLRLYIDVNGLEIPPEPFDCSSSRVFISFRDHSYHFSARRFIGGQRLLVPENVQAEMLEYLQEGQTLSIQVGRYQADITAEKFLPLFQRMVATQL